MAGHMVVSSDFDAHACLTADNTAGFTDALIIRDRYIILESSFLLDGMHRIAHENLDYRKMCVRTLGGEKWDTCGFYTRQLQGEPFLQ
jgi:hypothetical protein